MFAAIYIIHLLFKKTQKELFKYLYDSSQILNPEEGEHISSLIELLKNEKSMKGGNEKSMKGGNKKSSLLIITSLLLSLLINSILPVSSQNFSQKSSQESSQKSSQESSQEPSQMISYQHTSIDGVRSSKNFVSIDYSNIEEITLSQTLRNDAIAKKKKK